MPPLTDTTKVFEDTTVSDAAEINEAFLNALGVIHHNPNISFDAEMTDQVLDEIKALNEANIDSDASKRRKRIWADAANSSTADTYLCIAQELIFLIDPMLLLVCLFCWL